VIGKWHGRSTVTSVLNVIVNVEQVSLSLPEFMTFPERTKQMGKVKDREQLDLLNKEGIGWWRDDVKGRRREQNWNSTRPQRGRRGNLMDERHALLCSTWTSVWWMEILRGRRNVKTKALSFFLYHKELRLQRKFLVFPNYLTWWFWK